MDHGTDEASVEALAVRADWARARIVRALGALDARRREALGAGSHLKEKLALVAVVGAAVAVTGVTYWLIRAATASSRRPRERAMLVRRAWMHPDRFGQRESVLASVTKSLLATLATAAVHRAIALYDKPSTRATM